VILALLAVLYFFPLVAGTLSQWAGDNCFPLASRVRVGEWRASNDHDGVDRRRAHDFGRAGGTPRDCNSCKGVGRQARDGPGGDLRPEPLQIQVDGLSTSLVKRRWQLRSYITAGITQKLDARPSGRDQTVRRDDNVN
jgi:hypothetical protein